MELNLLLNAFLIYICNIVRIVNLSDFCDELIKCRFSLCEISWKILQFWSCHNVCYNFWPTKHFTCCV